MVVHTSVTLHLITTTWQQSEAFLQQQEAINYEEVPHSSWIAHRNMMVFASFLIFLWKQTQHELINSTFVIQIDSIMPMFISIVLV